MKVAENLVCDPPRLCPSRKPPPRQCLGMLPPLVEAPLLLAEAPLICVLLEGWGPPEVLCAPVDSLPAKPATLPRAPVFEAWLLPATLTGAPVFKEWVTAMPVPAPPALAAVTEAWLLPAKLGTAATGETALPDITLPNGITLLGTTTLAEVTDTLWSESPEASTPTQGQTRLTSVLYPSHNDTDDEAAQEHEDPSTYGA